MLVNSVGCTDLLTLKHHLCLKTKYTVANVKNVEYFLKKTETEPIYVGFWRNHPTCMMVRDTNIWLMKQYVPKYGVCLFFKSKEDRFAYILKHDRFCLPEITPFMVSNNPDEYTKREYKSYKSYKRKR